METTTQINQLVTEKEIVDGAGETDRGMVGPCASRDASERTENESL